MMLRSLIVQVGRSNLSLEQANTTLQETESGFWSAAKLPTAVQT